MALEYKMNEEKTAILINENGYPVVVEDGEKEIGLDAIHLYGKVPDLTNQLKQSKDNLQELAEKYKILDEVEDITVFVNSAKKAMDTIKNLEDKKLIEAGEVEAIKRQAQESSENKLEEIKTSMQTKIDELDNLVNHKTKQIYQLMVSDRFNGSKFVQEKLNMTSKMARAYFSNNFKIEENDGKYGVIGYFNNDEKIFSREKAGEVADFEEALAILVDKDPDRDKLLAGAGGSGSGARGSENSKGKTAADNLMNQYKDAQGKGNMQLMINLKNRLWNEFNIIV